MQSRKLPKNRNGRLTQFEKPQLNVPFSFVKQILQKSYSIYQLYIQDYLNEFIDNVSCVVLLLQTYKQHLEPT